jgi:tryptophanyl-tRNA synthetase
VPGLDGRKMSKSYGNAIDLFGDEKETRKRIMSIKTDSTPVEAPKPTQNSSLYDLLKLMAPAADFPAIDASWRQGGKGYGDFKKMLVEFYFAAFGPARARYQELQKDPGELERVLTDGAQRARALCAPIMDAVRSAVGV